MKTKNILFALFFSVIFFTGCENFLTQKPTSLPKMETEKNLQNVTDNLNENTKVIEKSTVEIRTQANTIDDSASKTKEQISDDNIQKVEPLIKQISDSSNKIVEETIKIDLASGNIVSASQLLAESKVEVKMLSGQVKILEKTVDKITSERDKAIEEKNSAIRSLLKWMIALSIFGLAVCFIAFIFYGSKVGLFGAGTSALILALSSFVNTYFTYIAIFGGLLGLVCVVLLIYHAFIHKKAFTEVVETVEVAKDNMSEEKKYEIFGNKKDNGVMNLIQSQTTKQLIQKTKQQMPNLWKYSKKQKLLDKNPST